MADSSLRNFLFSGKITTSVMYPSWKGTNIFKNSKLSSPKIFNFNSYSGNYCLADMLLNSIPDGHLRHIRSSF